MERIGVMQITDTLSAGGLERVAVNLANHLVSQPYRSHLCVTREMGPLHCDLSSEVPLLFLERKGRFDPGAILKLARYLRKHDIGILHAHGTSIFIAVAAAMLRRSVQVIWHDHYGRLETEPRNPMIYRVAAANTAGIISVTEPLARWARERLRMRADRVWYVSNFASLRPCDDTEPCTLPGKKGQRVVCVANFRPEKNHLNLLHAFRKVLGKMPEAHLLLVGAANDPIYLQKIGETISQASLARNVTWLASRTDIHQILRQCDIGVLSSASEGLPLALIEYGMAGLPVVATNVGQCAEVLDQGRAGLLVPASSSEALEHALLLLLRSAKVRKEMANNFASRVAQHYSADSAIKKICEVYEIVAEAGGKGLRE